MTRLLLLGVFVLGMTGIAVGQGKGHENDSAPEIDPSQAVSAIALLGGTTLVIRGRQRK